MAEDNGKRYYWLKLKEDFFDGKHLKAIRKLPQGDRLTIIYLKMQLKSLRSEGLFKYENIMPSIEEEIALLIDEESETVTHAIDMLKKMKLIEHWEDNTIYMSAMQQLIGSESTVAERVRKHRALKKQDYQMLQCNTDVTKCNTDIDIDIEKDIDIDNEVSKYEDINTSARIRANIQSYEEIMYDFGVREPVLKDALFEFIKHCQLNGRKVTNEKLKNLIIRLDFSYGDYTEKANALMKAVNSGYFDIPDLRDGIGG